ncbi:G-type lectin S-receptor-like serine/threonine-protein kinase LECRK3 [Eucalyptus grandis]|uniref:G-type lectin S-receptor-like serine/threonine-protein kinase LECRK3 n=1 Tax=Eucalyptus grandis TaxID=71139 RepID=UPI00192F0CFC|nr:G-type lectin S-receptor-like serine/threonine-protein kinase LECRK3 [Eucalyptus grandis]
MASVILGILLVLAPLPLSTEAQTHGNLTLGSSLTANDRNSSLLSPLGEFAFGFRRMGRGAHLLAIWFEKIEDKTIVWSANGGDLAPEGSKVQLTTDGLVLTDPRGRELWSSSLNGTGLAYAAMLDTGNFILASASHVNLWDSFSHPTDTILPTQQLDQGTKVNARYSEMNYSAGRFLFILQNDGNLVLYATPTPLVVSDAYWATNTVGIGFQLIFNQSGRVYLTARNGTVLHSVTSDEVPTGGFYQRAILEYDGVFRQYVHPKTANSSSGWAMGWSMVSYPVPPNICTSMNRDTGTGACGFNSYCTLGDDKIQRPLCHCPPGYTLLDSTNEMNGCREDFVSQSCDGSRPEKDQFALHDMLNADWPYSDYEVVTSKTEDQCREACLVDCFCAVAIFANEQCWKKKNPLINGRMDPSVDRKALIKVRIENSTLTSTGNGQKKNKNSTLVIIGSVLLSSSVFFNLLLLLISYLIYKSFRSRDSKFSRPVQINQTAPMRTFNYQELQEATDGFKEELGRGSFGTVYKGVLGSEDTNFVAVKMLATRTGESEKEFEREVSAIGQTNHKNLVQLLGFCNEGQHRLLVYEFMSNGSLADFLFGSSRPSWYKRIEIACGVARGLAYLHDDCTRHIIHCDIKPQNILLDGYLAAKISDFGLAKLLMANQTRTTTGIKGTRGYLAPEWFRNMPISGKVDVYSFGILLVELICCRKNFEPEGETEAQIVLVDWVYDCYRDGSVLVLVEGDEEASGDMRRVRRFVMTALWCIQEDPALRPNMKKITQMLEGAVEVSVPPDPSSFISSI